MHSECARTAGESTDRCGVPVLKIEIAAIWAGRFTPPGITSLLPVDSAIGRTLPLFFRGQRFACPARICHRFGVAYIDGPFCRQGNFVKHGAVEPIPCSFPPEHGMRDSLARLPVPGVIAPEFTCLVAAGVDEIQILAVRYFVLIDFKCRNTSVVRLVLVVPPEFLTGARKSEGSASSGDRNHSSNDRRTGRIRWSGLPNLTIKR